MQRRSALLTHAVLLMAAVLALAPFLIILNTSLHQTTSVGAGIPFFRAMTLVNYQRLFVKTDFLIWIRNSLITSMLTTAVVVLVDSAAGYAFAKKPFRGANSLFALLMVTIMVPIPITIIPTYILVARVNLLNTFTGIILPGLAAPVGVFMMRQYLSTMPAEFLEAARVDGASEWYIFFRIVLPLSRAPIATLSVFTFLTQWTSFLWPLLAGSKNSLRVATVGLASLQGQYFVDWGLVTAAGLMIMVPVALFIFLLQRNFVEGLTGAAFKG